MRIFLEHTQYWLYRFLTSKNYRKFIWYSIRYGNKKRFISRTFDFNNLRVFTPDIISFIWQFKEIFADENYKFKTDSANPVIYDCGSNIGTSCLYFSKNYPTCRIIAYEADPNIVKILRENLERNQIKNVEVFDKAVWTSNDGIDISLEGADGASVYSLKNLQKVPSIRLKDHIEKEIKIDMLKIDIEGAEYDVLKDCCNSLNNIENIFIEYHSFTESVQKLSEILNILEENNFRYFIKPVNDRKSPLINRKNKSNPSIDLQLNIYGYKIS